MKASATVSAKVVILLLLVHCLLLLPCVCMVEGVGADGVLHLFCDVVLRVLSSSVPEVIKNSCSSQLSMEFQMLIKS